MTTYEPSTVAVATVRGIKGVRVMRYGPKQPGWFTAEYVGDASGSEPQWRTHADHLVSDIRPLVVLDVAYRPETREELLTLLRSHFFSSTADQIEAQTKPPRIDEPGLWGVVDARWSTSSERFQFVRTEGGWIVTEDGSCTRWDDLVDPVLIREGLTS